MQFPFMPDDPGSKPSRDIARPQRDADRDERDRDAGLYYSRLARGVAMRLIEESGEATTRTE